MTLLLPFALAFASAARLQNAMLALCAIGLIAAGARAARLGRGRLS